ncbi:1-deoxy-D-xylulose-5-phosphate reductoisomerase [candidate division NPL-UPA2 bacterium]|nr:1-deoxy-D-xylulose-5-phosphate reductoisomerase [candidate division NPL-UPA2 bacterium]
MKRISILGSTGSVGTQTLEVIATLPDRLQVVGLTGKDEVELIHQQIERYHPEVVAMAEAPAAGELRRRVGQKEVRVLSGEEGIVEVAKHHGADLVVMAIVGSASLTPTLEAIRSGKTIALASKEGVVMAGRLLMEEAKKSGVEILPVDSEPNAIFQCLRGEERRKVRRLLLTASGGPFYNFSESNLKSITPAQALRHPTWKMGRKVTIDSATLMNKGLEVIEAHNFFDIDISQIEVVIHPQAKVHSLVEFVDGSVMAILGITDMRVPIQHALTYPERTANKLPPLDLTENSPLEFKKPDLGKFPCLKYAYEAGKVGGTMPAVLNAANEVAVEAFLNGKIGFLDIAEVSRRVMAEHSIIRKPDLNDIKGADTWARERAKEGLRKC